MNLIPRGCSGIGGELASCMEDCRNRALRLVSSYGYQPFNPAELQLLAGTFKGLARKRRERVVALSSPFGEPCCLRADITLSAVSYMASHYAPDEFPLRLSYAERVFAAPRPPKENLEETQVGVELLGWEGEGADAEVVALLFRVLDELGLDGSMIVLGDAGVVPGLFTEFDGLSPSQRALLIELLQDGAYASFGKMITSAQGLREGERRVLRELPSLKGEGAVLEKARLLFREYGVEELLTPLSNLYETLSALGYGDRLRIDLGFIRDLGYYSGPVFNVYSAGGASLGGGGRYDWILNEMGIAAQAVGFGLNLRDLAVACRPGKRHCEIIVWSGALPIWQALRYAGMLAEKGRLFELSWKLSQQDSLELARRRGARYWVNLEDGSARDMENGNTCSPLALIGDEPC